MLKALFMLLSFSIIFYINLKIFYPIYISNEIIIDYGINSFDICTKNPELWTLIKKLFIFSLILPTLLFSNLLFKYIEKFILLIFQNKKSKKFPIFNNLKTNKKCDSDCLSLFVGNDYNSGNSINISEFGLYQNIFITGSIGCGKTSSSMYPFTYQLLKYNISCDSKDKIGFLFLDVKGSYYKYVKKVCCDFNLLDDLIIIELGTCVKYNPLHKPLLKPHVIANQLKTILELFSQNNSESYWLDKVEQILCECIKLCRLYNKGYVTFVEIHKLVMFKEYFDEKLGYLKTLFIKNKLSKKEIYELNSCIDFFKKEFFSLDQRTISILRSEITRITNVFISDYDVLQTFSPKKSEITFNGFSEIINTGKIVVLNMNVSEYRNLSQIIATYLKLDFQTEILKNLSDSNIRRSAFICDEYDKYVSKTDGEFFSLSREAKCINIVSTQSYSSLKNVLKDDSSVRVILQNLVNKIWYRTDDIYTIEEIQKQLGKEEKERISKSISENAKETKYSYFSKSLNSDSSNISESFSKYTQTDFVYDTSFFTLSLKTFDSLTFLSDGNNIFPPKKLKMQPYFRKEY